MLLCCSCALAEEMDQLKSDMIVEQRKVKFYQAMVERMQTELESIQVQCIIIIVSLSFTLLIHIKQTCTCTVAHDTFIARLKEQ